MEIQTDLESCIKRIKQAKAEAKPTSIGFQGNVVSLWERLAQEEQNFVELGSDQTSLHNPFNGGYYPVQLSFEEANEMMVKDPAKFRFVDLVDDAVFFLFFYLI